MIDFKCKMCGGSLKVIDGQTVVRCDFCGTNQTLPVFDDTKKIAFYNRANILRFKCEFDKAAGVYETIVTEYSKEAEAYWGLVLCKYGVEYIDDPRTCAKIPTCHKTLFTSIFDDDDYKNSIKYSAVISREVYEEEAGKIAKIQKTILEITSNEESFDIFICYKESDEEGNRTEDSVLAFDIYTKLIEKNYKVFFSKITLEDKLGIEYEPYIYSALYSAKLMILVTTSSKHCKAAWVENEWKRYLSLIKDGSNKSIVSCYKGISAADLPFELQNLQGLDMSNLGSMQDLLHGVDKIFGYMDSHATFESGELNSKNDGEDFTEDTQCALEVGYQKYVSDLLELDEYCTYASDISPIISFFEKAEDFKESKKYLDMAKYEYAKRVNSYIEALQALLYLDDISYFTDIDFIRKQCKEKLIKFRTRDLQNKGYAVPNGDEETTYCLCSVIFAISETKDKQVKNKEQLDELDRNIIQICEANAISFISSVGEKIINNEWNKGELLKIKNSLESISLLVIPNTEKLLSLTKEKIHSIEAEERALLKKKKIKKIATISTIAGVLLLIIIITIVSNIVKNNGYSAEHFNIEVVEKSNEKYNENLATGYIGSGYFYIFDFVVENNSPNTIVNISGNMDINNDSHKTLATTTVYMNGTLKSGEKGTWNIEVNVPKGNNAIDIWNSDLSELEITFRITEIEFEDGTRKYYSDTKNKVVCPLSSGTDNS